MEDHVIRYVVTHIGKDGLRTLCGPVQGRITKETPEEAQQLLDSMMQNNLTEGERLAGVYGLPLEVRPVKCYPGHFDPIGIYFDTDASTQSSQESSHPPMSMKTENLDLIDEIKELHALAVDNAKKSNENGVDLNPFSTQGARHLWQQGWDGVRPANLTDGSINWRHWELGGQARSIAQETENTSERPRDYQPDTSNRLATEHTISYANKTSANAVKFGYRETGCAIVVTDVDLTPNVFKTMKEAEGYVAQLGTVPSSLSLDNPLYSENIAKAHFDGLLADVNHESKPQNERPRG